MSSDPKALADAREAVHTWIREDAPLVVKMRLEPKHANALVERLAALRACPAESGGSVTLSIEEHRRLLVLAGERPDGMFVRIAKRRGGPHPSEAHVAIATETGKAFCLLSERSIIAGHVSIGWPVGQKPGFLLVEMPRECDDGRWRIWVPETNVTREPEEAAIRALPDQPAGGGDA